MTVCCRVEVLYGEHERTISRPRCHHCPRNKGTDGRTVQGGRDGDGNGHRYVDHPQRLLRGYMISSWNDTVRPSRWLLWSSAPKVILLYRILTPSVICDSARGLLWPPVTRQNPTEVSWIIAALSDSGILSPGVPPPASLSDHPNIGLYCCFDPIARKTSPNVSEWVACCCALSKVKSK